MEIPQLDLELKIINNESCKVGILDQTRYEDKDQTYESYMSLDVIQINKTLSTQISETIFTEHEDQSCPIILPIDFDGWFRVYHIVLPTKSYIDSQDRTSFSDKFVYYYTDGEKIYKYYAGEESTVEVAEIMERNVESTSINRYIEDFFSICNLRKCYINLCNKIFDSMHTNSRCWDKTSIDSELRFKRDMLWMAINVITYLTQSCKFSEAQSILERLDTCNGLCNDVTYGNYKKSGCGCNKS